MRIVHLSDPTLHDDEIRIVDIKLDRLEQTQHGLLLHFMAIEDILCDVGQCDLWHSGLFTFVYRARVRNT